MPRKTIEQIRTELDELNALMAKKQTTSDIQIISVARANKNKADKEIFRKKMSEVKIGVKRIDMLGDKNIAKTPEERKRRKELMLGKPKSQSQINKFKESYKNLPMIKCPHCGKEGKNQGNMNRYHFDNCKLKDK